VPQLILAHGGDRPDNGRLVEALGCGRCLCKRDWTTHGSSSLASLLASPSVRDRVQEYRARVDNDAMSQRSLILDALGESVV
jgi:UDP:flavonoid glycosyltransferase YjiC (YdhE family)